MQHFIPSSMSVTTQCIPDGKRVVQMLKFMVSSSLDVLAEILPQRDKSTRD